VHLSPSFRDGCVDGSDGVSDQISKFLVPHMEESMAGHIGVMEFSKS
jgi:hypothetical protein